jgi:hypothetical protein
MTGIATKKCVDVQINKKSTVVRYYDKIVWGDANAYDGLSELLRAESIIQSLRAAWKYLH